MLEHRDCLQKEPMPCRHFALQCTVGFHNFNLRIFNLRVSNPNNFIMDVLLTRCRISMCQSLGPRKHYEISEIDRSSDSVAPAVRGCICRFRGDSTRQDYQRRGFIACSRQKWITCYGTRRR